MGYEIPEAVLTREVSGELVMLDTVSETYFSLDPIGLSMVEALGEAGTLDGAVDRLLLEYEVDEPTLRADLDSLVEQLVDRGLLVRTDPR